MTLMWEGQEDSCSLILEGIIVSRQEKLNDAERILGILMPSLGKICKIKCILFIIYFYLVTSLFLFCECMQYDLFMLYIELDQ